MMFSYDCQHTMISCYTGLGMHLMLANLDCRASYIQTWHMRHVHNVSNKGWTSISLGS